MLFYKQPNVDEIERTGMIFVRRGWDSSVTNIEATYEPRMAICKITTENEGRDGDWVLENL